MKIALVIALAVLFFMPVSGYINTFHPEKNNVVAELNRQIEIPPGGDYYIHFSPEKGIDVKNVSYIHNLTQKEKRAVARAPSWLQRELAKQFKFIGEEYADLLLSVDKKYVDEIAFSIAYSPVGDIPSPEILYDNAYFIYENDRHLDYVKVVDVNSGSNYYSTLQYKIIEDGKEKEIFCPPSIYYWFVVSPRATVENADYVYNKFWREYLFYHNDIGYPLLMEKLHNIKYLWDCKSYYPPAYRTWNWSLKNHPTAIEAINYWVGKSITALAIDGRPLQPNEVYHGHNGLCGEIQEIAVAAQRAALIPTAPINCLGEDHVWREFYERGWHECDNWWADKGGSVDNFDEYRYRWDKIISALFAWKGDSSIYDVTDHYIHKEDRGNVKVIVKDCFGNPVDGVRIMVFGSWKANDFKDKMWDKMVGKLWSLMPEKIKDKWEDEYEKAKKWYHEHIPGLIPWVLPSIWNYTDMEGKCMFHLGEGHSYLFALQKDDVIYFGPWAVGKSNAFHYIITIFPNETREIKITFVIPDGMPLVKKENVLPSLSSGDYEINVSFDTSAYQIQRNVWDWKYGREEVSPYIKFFIVDKENFEKYEQGEKFDCYEYCYSPSNKITFNASNKEWYLIFKNDARRSIVLVNFSLNVKTNVGGDYICINKPWSDVFDVPTFNIGDVVTIEGVSTCNGIIQINNQTFDVHDHWKIYWNTSFLRPGKYTIKAKCGNFEKEYEICLVDASPPILKLNALDKKIFEGNVLIKGRAYDNVGVDKVELEIDGKVIPLEKNFSYSWNGSVGEHIINIKATDWQGLETVEKASVIINESGRKWGPVINEIFYSPKEPTNESNIIVYANITKGSPFGIKKVEIEINGKIKEMFRYGDNPVQSRDEEDPLKNESNSPCYGIELGQFESGSIIKFLVKAFDNANNVAISKEMIIHVK